MTMQMPRWMRILWFLGFALLLFSEATIAQDQIATGSLTSVTCPGTGCVTLNIAGAGSGTIQLSGTWVGNPVFEATTDGTYTPLPAYPVGGSTAVSGATANGLWTFGAAGFRTIRVRVNTYTSGTVLATIRVSTGTQVVQTPAGGGGGGGDGAILDGALSTIRATVLGPTVVPNSTTDSALAVALRNPLPVGTNTIGRINQGNGGAFGSAWPVTLDDTGLRGTAAFAAVAITTTGAPGAAAATVNSLEGGLLYLQASGTYAGAVLAFTMNATGAGSIAIPGVRMDTGDAESTTGTLTNTTRIWRFFVPGVSTGTLLTFTVTATALVSGTVTIDGIWLPGVYSPLTTIMGTAKVDGSGVVQPVSGPLTDAQLRATAVPVSGSVTATGPLTDTQLRATPVPVSGSVTATGPLTDTQLRATAVPVSGTVVTGGLTDTQLRATAVPVSGPLTDTQLRATAVPVSGPLTDTQLRATPVPVSGTVAATGSFFQPIVTATGTIGNSLTCPGTDCVSLTLSPPVASVTAFIGFGGGASYVFEGLAADGSWYSWYCQPAKGFNAIASFPPAEISTFTGAETVAFYSCPAQGLGGFRIRQTVVDTQNPAVSLAGYPQAVMGPTSSYIVGAGRNYVEVGGFSSLRVMLTNGIQSIAYGSGAASNTSIRVSQANDGDGQIRVTDGTNQMSVKAASTLPAATDKAAVVTLRDVAIVQEGSGTRFSCFIQAVTVTTQCQAAPGAGLKAYITSVHLSNQAATVQTLDVVFGTGANCVTGTTALTHKWQMGTNATTTSPQAIDASFPTPLIPTAANAICVRPSAATAFGATITGYTAP